ncbi:hypothetical protein HZA44_00730 [Candidatus Peregrinibacteria bacterium]|nr:hypothetical protein [Candidatus Peregrinibacteria bacterium]
MSEVKSPKTLNEIIEELKGSMITRFPDQQEQIVSYAENVPKVIERFLSDDRGLDDMCAFFKQFDQIHSGKINPELQHEIEIMRFLIRDQLIKGNIVMPPMKNGKSALPEEK